ncbi:aspartate ammonia-lyase [Paenibacillus aceris]|uniref:Aspartate ammonia-lyase n=1 Tax=Paenibacillus aceris TaxID=869555 RepID=A0ABS4I9J3_9BACL|nr:aspartate ammonia-lyase [Paenibacillus aceris]
MSQLRERKKIFLEKKEVPYHAYYGIQTIRAVENFPITGYRIHKSLIRATKIRLNYSCVQSDSFSSVQTSYRCNFHRCFFVF